MLVFLALFKFYLEANNKKALIYIETKTAEINILSNAIINLEEREQFIKTKTAELMAEMSPHRDHHHHSLFSHPSEFIVVGYDKESKKIATYYFNNGNFAESLKSSSLVGSGTDAASIYFLTRLQGMSGKGLTTEELLFQSINAFSYATVNIDVGGRPDIYHIKETGVQKFSAEQTIAAANLSGAYLSEHLSQAKAKTLLKQLFKEIPSYETIAAELKMTVDTTTRLYVPFSSWQSAANK